VRWVSTLKYRACASSYLNLFTYFLKDSKFYGKFSFISTFIFRILALLANIKVESVSPKYSFPQWIFANSFVIEFPPSESLRKYVSFESRKGICFFFLADSTSELITLPKTCKDRLILHPSLSLSPSTWVCLTLSLPAKSTIFIFDFRSFKMLSPIISDSTTIVKMAWERELSVFIDVDAIFLVF